MNSTSGAYQLLSLLRQRCASLCLRPCMVCAYRQVPAPARSALASAVSSQTSFTYIGHPKQMARLFPVMIIETVQRHSSTLFPGRRYDNHACGLLAAAVHALCSAAPRPKRSRPTLRSCVSTRGEHNPLHARCRGTQFQPRRAHVFQDRQVWCLRPHVIQWITLY